MALLALSGTLHAAEDLKIKFDEKGLASIVHNGVVLVDPADARFMVQSVAFTDPLERNGVRQDVAAETDEIDLRRQNQDPSSGIRLGQGGVRLHGA